MKFVRLLNTSQRETHRFSRGAPRRFHLAISFVILLTIITVGCSPVTFATQVLQNASIVSGQQQIPVTSSRPFGSCGGAIIQATRPDFEQAIVEQTNQIRAQNGLPPLKLVEALSESARFHAADMSVNNYFDHNTLARVNGNLAEVCDTWNRIEAYYTNWQALAENIAAGQRTPQEAMNGWMNSPEHRRNILSPNYTEIGVGFYAGQGEYHYYWDQNFGNRNGEYPLIIDGEKAQTKTVQAVPIYIYGNFDQVRLSNDDGAWSNWMPFANNITWNLPDTPGVHQVTAEMRGKDGSAMSSDTIQVVR